MSVSSIQPTLAIQLIEENKKTKVPFLDLGLCGLTSLPDELFECEWITHLNLGGIYFNASAGKYIRSVNAGETNSFSENSLLLLKNLPLLRHLYLSGLAIPTFYFLTDLPGLSALDISQVRLTHMETISEFTNSSAPKPHNTYSVEYSWLGEMKELRWLNVRQTNVDGNRIKNLTNLEFLDISYAYLFNYSFIEKMDRLQTLYLHSNELTDISFLRNFKELRVLDLHRNKVTDYSPLEALDKMETLDISENTITNYSFLEKMPALQALDISENVISDYSFLQKIPLLKKPQPGHQSAY